MDDEASHFGHRIGRVIVQRRATVDHAVVLEHSEVFHVAFDDGATAGNQRAVRLERLDQLENGADVVDGGWPQVIQGIFDHHGAHAVVGEDFKQDHAIHREGDEVGARDAALDGA